MARRGRGTAAKPTVITDAEFEHELEVLRTEAETAAQFLLFGLKPILPSRPAWDHCCRAQRVFRGSRKRRCIRTRRASKVLGRWPPTAFLFPEAAWDHLRRCPGACARIG